MYVDLVIWDDENEPHVVGPGEVTIEEIEQVIRDHAGDHLSPDEYSDSSGLPLIYGDTSTGKHIVVIDEDLSEDELIVIRPITAYPVKEYGD